MIETVGQLVLMHTQDGPVAVWDKPWADGHHHSYMLLTPDSQGVTPALSFLVLAILHTERHQNKPCALIVTHTGTVGYIHADEFKFSGRFQWRY